MDATGYDTRDELKALREQVAAQERLLADKEARLAEHREQLAHKQLLLDESTEHIAWLEETLTLLKAKRYQHSSEKLDALQGQLFDESEMDASIREAKDKLDKEREERQDRHVHVHGVPTCIHAQPGYA